MHHSYKPFQNNQIKNKYSEVWREWHTLIRSLKSRKIQISKKEDSVKIEIGRHTHLLFELFGPVELPATESMISKVSIMKNVYQIFYLTYRQYNGIKIQEDF